MTTRIYTYTETDNDAGPALIDFDFWIGNTAPPVIFGSQNEGGSTFPTTGSVFTLEVKWPGGSIEKSTDVPGSGFVLSARNSDLTWTPTLAESLKIPLGQVAEYKIRRHVASYQQLFIVGRITGKDGINNV